MYYSNEKETLLLHRKSKIKWTMWNRLLLGNNEKGSHTPPDKNEDRKLWQYQMKTLMKLGEWLRLDRNGSCFETLPSHWNGPERSCKRVIMKYPYILLPSENFADTVENVEHEVWQRFSSTARGWTGKSACKRRQTRSGTQPSNAQARIVEQRASSDCQTTRKHGLPEKWEMVQGTNYAENCRRARTHMRSAPKMKLHEKCVKLSSALSDGEQCNCSGKSWFCWRPQHAKSVCKRLLDFSTDSISSEFKNIFQFIHV